MAETWKVQLNDEEAHGGGVYCGGSIATTCTNNTGKFNFASPSTGVNNYTITYTNGTQTTTTSFTVNAGDCVKCDCDKIEFTATEVNGQGGDGVQLGTFRVTSEFCKNAFTVTASAVSGGFVTNPRISGNKVLGNVGVNGGAPRNLKFNLLINNFTCPQTTTQKTGCNCNSITHTPDSTVTSFDGNGFTGKVATYSVSTGCDINKVGIQGDSVYTLTTEGSTHIVKASVGKNTGSSTRSFSYKLTYNNSQCDGKGRTITQAISCDCNSFKFVTDTEGKVVISASGGCSTNIGRIQGTTCGGSYRYLTASTTATWITSLSYSGVYLKGTMEQNSGRGGNKKTATILVTVEAKDGTHCDATVDLVQYASITDNDSSMDDVCKIHPLHISGKGDWGGSDDIFVSNPSSTLTLKKDTPFIEDVTVPLGIVDNDAEPGTLDSNTLKTGIISSLTIDSASEKIKFDLKQNETDSIRYAIIYLHYTGGGVYQEYGWVIAKQAKNGYTWTRRESDHKWIQVPDV
jgi:hypothetical protein